MEGMGVSLDKLLVGLLKRILVCIREISKANPLTFQQLAITLLSLKKTRSKAIESRATSNTLAITRNANTLASTLV